MRTLVAIALVVLALGFGMQPVLAGTTVNGGTVAAIGLIFVACWIGARAEKAVSPDVDEH